MNHVPLSQAIHENIEVDEISLELACIGVCEDILAATSIGIAGDKLQQEDLLLRQCFVDRVFGRATFYWLAQV